MSSISTTEKAAAHSTAVMDEAVRKALALRVSSPVEFFDILDESGRPTGEKRPRSEVHSLGLLHSSAHIWIYNTGGEILVQKRSAIKDSYPGLWDVSVAGHLSAGESPAVGALCELWEEARIIVPAGKLLHIGSEMIKEDRPERNWFNHEVHHIFLLHLDVEAGVLERQVEEVEEFSFMKIEKLLAEIEDPSGYAQYVPHGRPYYRKIFTRISDIWRQRVKAHSCAVQPFYLLSCRNSLAMQTGRKALRAIISR